MYHKDEPFSETKLKLANRICTCKHLQIIILQTGQSVGRPMLPKTTVYASFVPIMWTDREQHSLRPAVLYFF